MATLQDLVEDQQIAHYGFIRWAERTIEPWVHLYQGLRVLGYDPVEDHEVEIEKHLSGNR